MQKAQNKIKKHKQQGQPSLDTDQSKTKTVFFIYLGRPNSRFFKFIFTDLRKSMPFRSNRQKLIYSKI